MNHPPIKRHESLQPFSRDHYAGLVQAQHLRRAGSKDDVARLDVLRECVEAWQREIKQHFDDEERLLLPLINESSLVDRLLEEHVQLRQQFSTAERLLQDGTTPVSAWMQQLGNALHDHIRWEERELFPAIEAGARDDALRALGHATRDIESTRPRWDRAPSERKRSRTPPSA